jgi:inward rectifier potassium channel
MSDPTPPPIIVKNAPRRTISDVFHVFLTVPWSAAAGWLTAVWLFLNIGFATAFLVVGGVANARPGSFLDAFDFSVQTMATIGYGGMTPTSVPANLLVDFESIVGIGFTAVCTGLVFAKFTRSTAKIAFSRSAVISPMDGVPTLQIRIGNERGNRVLDAQIRVVLIRTELTAEGNTFYRMLDLALVRDRAPALTRSMLVMHRIDAASPLFGATPESLIEDEIELAVSVFGVDDTTTQPMHGLYAYTDAGILWGYRHVDLLSELPTGQLVVDAAKFHDVVKTVATAGFPYPRA